MDFCKNLILFRNFKGILVISTKPSVNALKYKPVPPTKIGIFFLFLISFIFLIATLSQSPVEKSILEF